VLKTAPSTSLRPEHLLKRADGKGYRATAISGMPPTPPAPSPSASSEFWASDDTASDDDDRHDTDARLEQQRAQHEWRKRKLAGFGAYGAAGLHTRNVSVLSRAAPN